MSSPNFDIGPIREDLIQGNLILTPNQRLARAIHQSWGMYLHQRNERVWNASSIYALDTWLEKCWQELRESAFPPSLTSAIASEAMELLLWERVIKDDEKTPPGASLPGLARLARQAQQYLVLWHNEKNPGFSATSIKGDEFSPSVTGHQGYQLFQRCLPQFLNLMAAGELITREQSLNIIQQGFTKGLISKIPNLLLVGFQNLPLKQKELLETATEQIAEHSFVKENVPATKHCKVAMFPNSDAEIAAAAQWAKIQIEKDPQQQIGVVFPDLIRKRDRVDRSFRSTLSPEYCLPETPNEPPPFNISVGISLSEAPLIQAALKLLTLDKQAQPLSFYCVLLNNPFWGSSDSDVELRTQAEIQLRELGQTMLQAADFRSVIHRAEDFTEHDIPLSTRLQRTAELCRRRPTRQSFSAWANHICVLLESFGWPGPRTLDSIEYQQLQQWRQVLDNFSDLDASKQQPNWAEAFYQLRELISRLIFQPQTPDSPVQVLGALEAAGLSFDALWIADMSDEHWPQSVQLNPLLPANLQIQAAMPRTSAERELIFARELIKAFINSANTVVFSYSERDGDVEKRCSPLVKHLPLSSEQMSAGLDHPLAIKLADNPVGQAFSWGDAPALDPRTEKVRGGSGLIKDQATCPFNAFVRWRLGASLLPEPGPGLSALERGNLIHRCLELFWSKTASQAVLLTLSETERTDRLKAAIHNTLDEMARYRPDLNGIRFRRVESTRLQKLLERWLDLEAQRPPFTVVANEHSLHVELNVGGEHSPLILPLRIDRVDQLANGGLLLIDYKTGKVDIKTMTGIRPEQPQLPLYALAMSDHPVFNNSASDPAILSALCFAQISTTQGVALVGISDISASDNQTKGIQLKTLDNLELPETWAETINEWRNNLEAIAKEFMEGDAEVTCYTDAVKYQEHLTPLNRLAESDDIHTWQQQNSSETEP